MPPGGETADGQKYARRVLRHKNRSIRKFYITCVGKMCTYIVQYILTQKHTAMWEKSTKSISVEKNIPLSPQVHTTDIPQDLRAHMDKSVFFR